MRAVVTAGGTSEPIDDVRVITNFSSGRFGAAIANALARRGHEVVLLAGRQLASHPERVDRAVRVVAFGSYADLDAALDDATATAPDVLFMAAAVSDYSPVRTPGKIRSEAEELVLTLRRNPKMIARLRDRCGPDAFLVGFKLLSGVSEADLVRVGEKLVRDNRLDLCVANDLQRLGGAEHPIVVLTPEGGVVRRTGSKDAVAGALVELVERRARARRLPVGEVEARLVRAVTGLTTVRRIRDAVVLPTAEVAFPWPPDTVEEAAEIEHALLGAAWEGTWGGGPFAVKLEPGAAVGIADAAAFDTAVERLASVGGSQAPPASPPVPPVPILDGGTPVGVAVRAPEGVWTWLEEPDLRRRDRLIEALAAEGARAVAEPDDLWREHGWRIEGQAGPLAVLAPPSESGRIEAASVCLLDPVGRRVLIGRRRTPPWQGYWAFPGGRRMPGEDLLATALRELREETGIEVAEARAVRVRKVLVGADPGFVVTNFVVPVLGAHVPLAGEELEGRWVDLGAVAALRPMAAGTRRVLAGLDRVRW